MRRITLVLLAAALLTGCAGVPDPDPDPPTAPGATDQPEASDETRALGLVGLWRVSGAEGEEAETWLRLDAAEFQLWRDCGMIFGSWNAGESAFLASAYGSSGSCSDGAPPAIAWLESASAYAQTDDGWQLADSAGAVVAELTVDGAPEPIETAAEWYTEPPEVTAEVRETFRRPAPLPPDLVPATAATLAGRWVPIPQETPTDPHAVFAASGTWEGSDGCNGGGGRWALGADGELLTTAGPSTLIWCEGAPVPSWVASARLAAFDGDRLLLLDLDGIELGQLERG